jgi:stalled ribosome alternative rescue factor ArfA
MPTKQPPKHNPLAQALASPLFKQRIIKSRKIYSRKKERKKESKPTMKKYLLTAAMLTVTALASIPAHSSEYSHDLAMCAGSSDYTTCAGVAETNEHLRTIEDNSQRSDNSSYLTSDQLDARLAAEDCNQPVGINTIEMCTKLAADPKLAPFVHLNKN